MPTVVHMNISAEDTDRVKKFYERVFNWTIKKTPFEGYYSVETQDLEGAPGLGGGIWKRSEPSEEITVYVGVDSIDEYMEKIKQAGGILVQGKMPVPHMGYTAMCRDSEGNLFGLWQDDPQAA